ncbi:hypothetical protein [Mesobacillus subterraneus]|uniref:Fimbrial protein n=1 Tax=Mesobacillus subterraneus TaxID=285983 RepID=A0A427TI83_9BACI|nr:hypothetical protein [Mesobacillus subterraneus]RSD23313.1 hypothetical protein EJA10_20290 [Mesobacillus subterraneus]
MLVEINLLPKKEHRKSSQLIIAFILFLLFAGMLTGVYLQGSNYSGKMKSLDHQIEVLQKLNTAQQEKLAADNAGNSMVKLQAAVQWAEQYPMDAVPLLQGVISLLPERGFIQNFEYNTADSILVTIQYDASREAAYYLSSLKQADWVQDAELLSIVAAELEEEAAVNGNSQNSDEKTLPRYSAVYKITYDQDVLKDKKRGGNES